MDYILDMLNEQRQFNWVFVREKNQYETSTFGFNLKNLNDYYRAPQFHVKASFENELVTVELVHHYYDKFKHKEVQKQISIKVDDQFISWDVHRDLKSKDNIFFEIEGDFRYAYADVYTTVINQTTNCYDFINKLIYKTLFL